MRGGRRRRQVLPGRLLGVLVLGVLGCKGGGLGLDASSPDDDGGLTRGRPDGGGDHAGEGEDAGGTSVCTAGALVCRGNALAHCNADGSGFDLSTACAAGQTCAVVDGVAACRSTAC